MGLSRQGIGVILRAGNLLPRKCEHNLKRPLQIRQVEAFKALIEQGTASRAAAVLHVTQPAVSKLLSHLEEETGLVLFERVKGRLSPTEQGIRFYAEVDRIFSGMRQLEESIAIIQRNDKRHFSIGVLPALSGPFIQRVTMMFLSHCPDVYPTVHTRASNMVSDRVAMRQMDVGLTSSLISNPNLVVTPIMEIPLVCIMPKGHHLSELQYVSPDDLRGVPFVSYTNNGSIRTTSNDVLRAYGINLNIVLECETAPTLCEFVCAGLGVSLVHPLSTIELQHRMDIRHFKPDIVKFFHLCHVESPRNVELIQEYKQCVQRVANATCAEILTSAL